MHCMVYGLRNVDLMCEVKFQEISFENEKYLASLNIDWPNNCFVVSMLHVDHQFTICDQLALDLSDFPGENGVEF